MKSFLDFAKQKENDELKRQVDHFKQLSDKNKESAENALMIGDRDGHALFMAKVNHFDTQYEFLKSKMNESVEQIDELDTGTLKRYTKKALSQTMSSAKKGDMETSNKRFAGMSKALDKIKTREPMDTSRSLKNITKNWHKEEVDLDESHVAIAMGKELDDEGSMIMNQLDQIERSIKMLRDTVKDPEMQIPAWVQSKVTLAADYMETVAGYMSSKNEKVSEEVDLDEASPAWQRKEGKSASGGLNRKGIASYRKQNPGSKLSMAVTTKPSKLKPGSKAANRRKSFCARMSGMKKRLTSAKTAKDPNSRINKSLRKWNC